MSTPAPPTTVPDVRKLDVAQLEKALTHRIQRLHIFRGPDTAPIPEAITYASGANVAPELLELDADDGWADMGLIGSDDAPTVSRDMDQADLMAIGFRDPIRSDMTQDTASFTATFLEHSKPVLEVYENIDMDGIVPDPVTGEIKWVRPPDGPLIQSRYAMYGQDGVGADRVWIVKFLTAGVLQEVEDLTMGGEDYTTFGVTMKGLVDTELDTSMVSFMGGPGFKKHLVRAGFALAA